MPVRDGVPAASGQQPVPGTISPAGEALLSQGRAQRAAGETALAAVALERALRIEPRRPEIWLELARVRMDEGNFPQAEQLARKARSLAAPDGPLSRSIDQLVSEAEAQAGSP